jgi:hypothetical protein
MTSPKGSDWLDRLDPKRKRLHQMVVVGTRVLTREEANEWLDRVDETHQRNRTDSRVERYRRDMNNQDWVPGTNIAAFDGKGRLINAQHMLGSFAGSNLEKLFVIWEINCHPNAYMGFDHNKVRRAADTLKWDGVDRAGEIAALATVLWQYEAGFFKGKGFRGARSGERFPTDAQIQKIVKMHPGLGKHLWKNPFRGKGFSIGAMNAASYIFDSIDRKLATGFFEMFVEGIRFQTPRDPINVLRKEFLGMGDRDRMRNGDTLLRFFKAWNAQQRGETVPGALVKKDDVFEDPIDPANLEPYAPQSPGKVQ